MRYAIVAGLALLACGCTTTTDSAASGAAASVSTPAGAQACTAFDGSKLGLAGAAARLLRDRFAIMTPMRILQVSLIVALVPLLLLLIVAQPWQAYVLVAVLICACTTGTALTPTMLQDIAPGPIRGQVIAINTVFYAVMGSLAPVLVGAASDAFSAHPRGLLWAVVLVTAPSLAAAAMLLILIDRPFRRTITSFAPG